MAVFPILIFYIFEVLHAAADDLTSVIFLSQDLISAYLLYAYVNVLHFADISICTAGSVWMKIGEVPTSPGYAVLCYILITKKMSILCAFINAVVHNENYSWKIYRRK